MSEPMNSNLNALSMPKQIKRATWASVILMVAHLAAGFHEYDSVWGLDFLRFYPLWCWGAFIVLGLLLLVPSSRSVIVRFLERISNSFFWKKKLLIFLMALATFYFFQTETYFLGDGDLLLRDLDVIKKNEHWGFPPRAPLVLGLMKFLDDQALATPLTLYQFYSWISGGLYLLVCCLVAREIGTRPAEKGLLFGALSTSGFMQLFFGYVENYALIFPLVLGFLLSGYRALSKKGSLLLPIGLLGIMIPVHFMTLSFFPALLMLVYFCTFSAHPRAIFLQRLFKAIFVSLLPLFIAFIILIAISFDMTTYLRTPKHHTLSLYASSEQYGVFSFTHLFDLANLYLLTAPFALMGLTLVPVRFLWQNRPQHLFIGVAALFPIALTTVFNPEIGFFRDWDALSIAALPLTLWVTLLLIARVRHSKTLWHIGVLLVGASTLHTALWIGVNANEDRGVARYEYILRHHAMSDMAHAWSWETLGIHYLNRGELELAREAYLQAIDITPGNARFWNAVGLIHLRAGEADLALPYFQRALEKNNRLAEAEANIGSIYLSQKQYADAQRHYARAVQIRPHSAPVHVMLGKVHFLQAHWDLSIRHYEAATVYDPTNVAAWYGLGAGFFKRGAFDAAIGAFREVVLLQPDHAEAVFGIGLCFDRTHQPDSAAVYLSRAATLNPGRFADSVHADIDSLIR